MTSRASTLLPDGPVHWGVMLAQGWKGELAGLTAEQTWATARDWAHHAEVLGFDGIWAFDHLQPYPARDDSPVLEAWTTLSALSQTTREIVLGTLVSSAAYRHAAVTAKMGATLGTLAAGRFCLGVGAGWDEQEFAAFRIPYGSAAQRSDQLEQTLLGCRRWWGDAAEVGPEAVVPIAPTPSPRPRILVGGEGRRRTLRSAATHADLTNWQVGVDDFVNATRALERWCDHVGRDLATIRRTHAPNVCLFDSEGEFRKWRQNEARGMSARDLDEYIRSRGAFYGTRERVVDLIQGFREAGCAGFIMYCNDSPAREQLERLIELKPASA